MFKKVLLAGSILAVSSSVALAGTPYIGGSLGVSGFKHQSGVIANLFGGYGDTLDQSQKIYLGGELNLNLAHYSKFSTMYGLGVSLLPGIMLSKYTMLYGRAGLDLIDAPHNSNTQNIIFGTQYGLGLQTNVAEKWDVRGEYVYSNARRDGQFNLGLVYKFN